MKDHTQLAATFGANLKSHHLKLATAESCTGGWLSEVITSIPGSSLWFERGFVTYSNESKQEMLGVSAATLQQHGAVSEQTASEMAAGALQHSHAELSVAITGIAGPDGGTTEKPVGLVCFAVARVGQKTIAWSKQFSGERNDIRGAAVTHILEYFKDRYNYQV